MKTLKMYLPALGICALVLMGAVIHNPNANAATLPIRYTAEEPSGDLSGLFIVSTKWVRPIQPQPALSATKLAAAESVLAIYGQ